MKQQQTPAREPEELVQGQNAAPTAAEQVDDPLLAQRQEAQQRAREEIGQFAALFPGVGPQEVPQEVWQEVRRGQSLAMAYALWRIRTLEDSLERRERSARRSAGSVSSAGSATLGGTVASFWDAYEV